MRSITIQLSEYTDHITADGAELTRLPYPFHVEPNGEILRQDFWNGRVLKAIGFVADIARQEVDLWWDDYALEAATGGAEKVVGMYLITEDSKGTWATHQTAISHVKVNE